MFFSLSTHVSSRSARNPPMLASPSFFALIVQPSERSKISRTSSRTERPACPAGAAPRAAGLTGRPLPDEPRVLGEAARVDQERHAVPPADLVGGADVLERDGLSAPGVVRQCQHDQGNPARIPGEAGLQAVQV